MADELLALLRKTFDTIMRDPQFLAEAERRKVEINEPMRGDDAAQVVEKLYAANPALIKKASAAVHPGGASSQN
jgi:hypothetical protein